MPADEPCLTVTRQTRVRELVTTYTRFYHPGSRHRITSHFDFRAEHGAEPGRQR
jgi:DNA-binding GntR family transcriptional regulator